LEKEDFEKEKKIVITQYWLQHSEETKPLYSNEISAWEKNLKIFRFFYPNHQVVIFEGSR